MHSCIVYREGVSGLTDLLTQVTGQANVQVRFNMAPHFVHVDERFSTLNTRWLPSLRSGSNDIALQGLVEV